ncbi:hypothetical protein [Nocardia brasiliensis]|uniref:hypothetical protein n=1 Tax=Nocardia brasiliensis TaxID=37326 RepID=UPI00366AE169
MIDAESPCEGFGLAAPEVGQALAGGLAPDRPLDIGNRLGMADETQTCAGLGAEIIDLDQRIRTHVFALHPS